MSKNPQLTRLWVTYGGSATRWLAILFALLGAAVMAEGPSGKKQPACAAWEESSIPVALESTRAQIRSLLGEPEEAGPLYDTYSSQGLVVSYRGAEPWRVDAVQVGAPDWGSENAHEVLGLRIGSSASSVFRALGKSDASVSLGKGIGMLLWFCDNQWLGVELTGYRADAVVAAKQPETVSGFLLAHGASPIVTPLVVAMALDDIRRTGTSRWVVDELLWREDWAEIREALVELAGRAFELGPPTPSPFGGMGVVATAASGQGFLLWVYPFSGVSPRIKFIMPRIPASDVVADEAEADD